MESRVIQLEHQLAVVQSFLKKNFGSRFVSFVNENTKKVDKKSPKKFQKKSPTKLDAENLAEDEVLEELLESGANKFFEVIQGDELPKTPTGTCDEENGDIDDVIIEKLYPEENVLIVNKDIFEETINDEENEDSTPQKTLKKTSSVARKSTSGVKRTSGNLVSSSTPKIGKLSTENEEEMLMLAEDVAVTKDDIKRNVGGQFYSKTKSGHTCQLCSKEIKGAVDKFCRHYFSIHAIIKPFTCQYCDKGFGRKDKLNSHIRDNCTKRPKYKKQEDDKPDQILIYGPPTGFSGSEDEDSS